MFVSAGRGQLSRVTVRRTPSTLDESSPMVTPQALLCGGQEKVRFRADMTPYQPRFHTPRHPVSVIRRPSLPKPATDESEMRFSTQSGACHCARRSALGVWRGTTQLSDIPQPLHVAEFTKICRRFLRGACIRAWDLATMARAATPYPPGRLTDEEGNDLGTSQICGGVDRGILGVECHVPRMSSKLISFNGDSHTIPQS